MTSKITIYKDDDYEMMKIVCDGKIVFEGNYWDFERYPEDIAEFLRKLKVSVGVQEYEHKQ